MGCQRPADRRSAVIRDEVMTAALLLGVLVVLIVLIVAMAVILEQPKSSPVTPSTLSPVSRRAAPSTGLDVAPSDTTNGVRSPFDQDKP